MIDPVLRAVELKVRLGGNEVLRGVSLAFSPGWTAIVGTLLADARHAVEDEYGPWGPVWAAVGSATGLPPASLLYGRTMTRSRCFRSTRCRM